MKVVMIGGSGGSGGLIGYIQGLLSFQPALKDTEVVLFCDSELAKKLEGVTTSVKIIETKYATEKGKDIILNKPLHPQIIRKVNEEKPDVIFFLNGYLRKGLEGYPTIMTLHNQLYVDSLQLVRQGFTKITLNLLAFRYVVRKSMRYADGVIFLSDFSKTQADRKRINYKNGVVIPFGFEGENRRKNIELPIRSNKIKIIYISAIFPYKNHLNVIKACSILKDRGYDIELSLVGQMVEPYYKKIKKNIKKLNLTNEVIFLNWVEHDKIKHLIDASDIFIYASSTETTGYGLIEGMSRGALIASSSRAGFPSILQDGGVYFDPKKLVSIVKAVEYLINLNSEECLKIKEKALEHSQEYSWEKAGQKHYEYFTLIKNIKMLGELKHV